MHSIEVGSVSDWFEFTAEPHLRKHPGCANDDSVEARVKMIGIGRLAPPLARRGLVDPSRDAVVAGPDAREGVSGFMSCDAVKIFAVVGHP